MKHYYTYFFIQELLEELDLEPTILLDDLNYSVLKAMIEFMYCGETTVNQVHLPSLLTAARIFRVRYMQNVVFETHLT